VSRPASQLTEEEQVLPKEKLTPLGANLPPWVKNYTLGKKYTLGVKN